MPFGASRKGIIMRDTALTYPGVLSNGYKLRSEAAKAISTVEIAARATSGGKTAGAAKLSAFFASCVAALATYIEAVLPTVVTRVRTAANTATITMSEALNPSTSVPLTSVVFSPARTVTAIVVTGSTIVVTATGVIATDTITYTPPSAVAGAGNATATYLGVTDLAGNAVATFTGVLA